MRDSKKRDFERRIAYIHGLARPGVSEKKALVDIRHAEFQAMADAFLGPNFDRLKVERVEALQVKMRTEQSKLHGEFLGGGLTPEQYFDALDSLFRSTFYNCELILGKRAFARLFGEPAAYLGILDKNTFLQQTARDKVRRR